MKKYVRGYAFILVLLMLFSSASCRKTSPVYTAGDSSFHASVSRPAAEDEEYNDERMQSLIVSARDVFISYLSLLDKNSRVFSKINSSVDTVFDCDGDILQLLRRVITLSDQTGGAFQPCGGAYTLLFDSDADPDEESKTAALEHVGCDKFEITDTLIKKNDRLAAFDLYAVAEGYALQMAAESLAECGASYGILTSESVVGTFGTKPDGEKFTVAVPSKDGYLGTFCIPCGYVAYVSSKSVTYDPNTDGGFESVAVYAADGVTATALANAIWIAGAECEKLLSENMGGAYCMAAQTKSGELITSHGAVESGLFIPEENDSGKE